MVLGPPGKIVTIVTSTKKTCKSTSMYRLVVKSVFHEIAAADGNGGNKTVAESLAVEEKPLGAVRCVNHNGRFQDFRRVVLR
jgi:hypothetical protein